jgi:hypothetical protein
MSIIIPLTALGISWGIMTARLQEIDRRQVIIETKLETQIQTNQEIKISLTQLEKDIQYIKVALDKHI